MSQGNAPAEPATFRELYEEHGPLVLRLLRRFRVHESEREDVAQEVWNVVHRAATRYDPARGTRRAWIAGIARNAARDWHRMRRRRRACCRAAVGLASGGSVSGSAFRFVMRCSFASILRVAAALPLLGIAAACVASSGAQGSGPHEVGRGGPLASGSAAVGAPGASGAGAADGTGTVYLAGDTPPPAGHAFDPPPLGPQPAPPPLPPRPADKVPSAEEQARKIADCARFNDKCNDCAEAHKCGYCPDNGKCTPGDLFGPYPGTCSGAWSAMQCIMGPKEAEKHDAETRQEMAKRLAGFTADGGPVDHPLKDVKTPIRLQVKRGRCYQVSLRLSGDVDERWDLKPAILPHVTYYEGGNGVGAGFDGFVFDKMCPQEDGTVDVYLGTERGKKGSFRAQLWSAPVSEKELAQQKEEHDTTDRRSKIGAWCKSCIEEWARCRVAAEPRCAFEYYHCLAAAHLTPADCERGDIAPLPPEPEGPKNEARVGRPLAL